jgi:peptide/nickel transport system ATP-binding protein
MRAGWLEESHAGAAPPPIGAAGDHPDLCRFLPRCAARVDGLCNTTPPPRHPLAKGSRILCHHGDESLIPS